MVRTTSTTKLMGMISTTKLMGMISTLIHGRACQRRSLLAVVEAAI
jgi:hypothetical protein